MPPTARVVFLSWQPNVVMICLCRSEDREQMIILTRQSPTGNRATVITKYVGAVEKKISEA